MIPIATDELKTKLDRETRSSASTLRPSQARRWQIETVAQLIAVWRAWRGGHSFQPHERTYGSAAGCSERQLSMDGDDPCAGGSICNIGQGHSTSLVPEAHLQKPGKTASAPGCRS